MRPPILAVILAAALASHAEAAQLFPPENEPDCGPGTHLAWRGGQTNVRCEADVIIPGTLCGAVFWETSGLELTSNIQNVAACNGQPLMDASGNPSCPAGWQFTRIHYSWGYNGSAPYEYHSATCAYSG